jgi:flagellar biosynthetic protein FliR
LTATLPPLAFAFVLLMSRIGAAMMLLPCFGEAQVPRMVRLGWAFATTVLLLPGVAPTIPAVPELGSQAAFMVAAEILTGIWLGWLARLLLLALPIGGQFIAYMLGLANVLQPDAELGGEATPISQLFALAAPLVLLVSGLYAVPLAALAGSYEVIPAGAMLPAADSAGTAARAVTASFALALRIASPFLLLSIVWSISTGLLARLVPRLQVYFAVMPAQIIGGVALLAILAATLLAAWEAAVRAGFSSLPGL